MSDSAPVGASSGAPASPSATVISADTKPSLGRGFRLQWEPAQKAHVLLYPEGMVKLNGSAGEILKRCNGERTVAEIVGDLESAFSTTGLEKDVRSFMAFALEKQWLEIRG